ncbi:baculoviral IAP repeat-containing protein 7 isoform X2 [Pelodiscus sinensis]|uniref:baculoviral IAP repeat-containing protein 7 isoform X2 n=1 Tax=Pelodiscus sinensis TaxID=13735 RepID=UPI003F6AF49A
MEASFLPDERGSGPRHFQLSKADMRSEEKRLRTFQQWPESSPVSATDLAKAGFFFLGPDDRVQCFCCGGILWSWEAEDEPMREHGKFFPTCKFICGEVIGNQRMIPFKKILDYVDGQILSLLQRMDVEDTALPSQPEYPEMETEAVRLTTFENWPPYTDLYPEHLARAGFFYTGQGDTVRCFYCDGSLRNWELGDDPWREHAKWFPRCEFLLRSRGREFVSRVQDAYYNSPGASWQQAEQNPPTPQDPVGNRDMSSPLDQSSLVQDVLQMGFDQSLVMSLVQSKRLLTGTCYLSVSELVLDLLQVDGAESSSAGERESTPRQPDVPGPRQEAQAESSKESELPQSTEEQLRRLQEERMCKVCMDKDVSIVFVPCGHLVVCAECAPSLRRCPICRAVIRGSVRTFMS